jgi:hypothetical protein
MALERVKQYKDILIDYDLVAGGMAWTYTDLPGNAMTLRRPFPLPASATRRSYAVPLDFPSFMEGTLFKFRITSAGIGRIYGATLRQRKVGVHFDGSQGESWDPQPLKFEHVMQFREIELDLQVDAAATLNVSTEMPGPLTSPTASLPIATTPGRTVFNSRLPGNTKGRMFQPSLIATGITRLFGAKVLAKPLGGPSQMFGGDWQWIALPVEPTPEAWTSVEIPMNASEADFRWIELPVDSIT